MTENDLDEMAALADPPKIQNPGKPSVTVVEHIYHQLVDESPEAAECAFETLIESDEQPWRRTKTITSEWEQVSFGWLESPGVVFIKNDPQRQPGNPTPEQIEAEKAAVLLVSFGKCDVPAIETPPHTSCRFQLCPGVTVFVRCQSGSTRMTLFCCPR